MDSLVGGLVRDDDELLMRGWFWYAALWSVGRMRLRNRFMLYMEAMVVTGANSSVWSRWIVFPVLYIVYCIV